jgi:hypothetical protein
MYRLFREENVNHGGAPIRVSDYLPSKMVKALEFVASFYRQIYILCPIYDKEFDMQLGVTGKTHQGESKVKGIQREFWEELGVNIDVAYLSEIPTIPDGSYFFTNIKFHTNGEPVMSYKKDTKRKVGGLVCGTKEDCEAYLQSGHLYNIQMSDDIIGIGCVEIFSQEEN